MRPMKHRKRKAKVEKGAPKWMTTYADMITLILVFFVLLFSMSQISEVKFDSVAESFKNRMIFDFMPSPVESKNPTDRTEVREIGDDRSDFDEPVDVPEITSEPDEEKETETEEAQQLDQLMQEVEEFLEKNKLQDIISAERSEKGVVLVLQEQVLFESGEASILESGRPFLGKLRDLLIQVPNHVRVEGHTDDRPIATAKFPSNWELSGARAGSVIRYLQNNDPRLESGRFTAVGYGSTRPVVENNSKENWRKNRRVEIVILESEYENNKQASPSSS
ncbi:chemotaxis protein MotB [Salimicrobium album]|uniref:Chemotaxis protein MotB n=3 Tax=Bacillaceae TaxID=186817 RepID=A0ABY1KZ73_9BACI|nr:chemotaxis protein MotB [Salimicrobium album]SIS94912.1 chemotaxis protein MotB [Salimicrobium salexigens]